MTINIKTGEIGFSSKGRFTPQWWKPEPFELIEFAEDAEFWASVILRGDISFITARETLAEKVRKYEHEELVARGQVQPIAEEV